MLAHLVVAVIFPAGFYCRQEINGFPVITLIFRFKAQQAVSVTHHGD